MPLAEDCLLVYIELSKEFHNWTEIWENIKYPNMPICWSFMFGRELCLRCWPTINPDVIMIFYQKVDTLHRNEGEKCNNCWRGWQISRAMRTPWLIFSWYFSPVPQWASQTLRLVNCYHLTRYQREHEPASTYWFILLLAAAQGSVRSYRPRSFNLPEILTT